jgi:hypothetical protein
MYPTGSHSSSNTVEHRQTDSHKFQAGSELESPGVGGRTLRTKEADLGRQEVVEFY